MNNINEEVKNYDLTVFEILGVENKELPISSLLAYYFADKQRGLKFLNRILELAKIEPIDMNEEIFVEKEALIKNNGNKNYIDILVKVKNIEDKENPKRIICIENKIYSEEGLLQTKRYYEALEKEFHKCNNKQYLYLTKNNSAIDLSSMHFKHIKYLDMESVLVDKEFSELPFINDFYEFYINREKEKFNDIEENDKKLLKHDKISLGNYEISLGNYKKLLKDDEELLKDYEKLLKDDFNNLIDYIVWKINSSSTNKNYNNYFCSKGKSAQADRYFYQISLHNWEFMLEDKAMTIHIEGIDNGVFVHMEMKPYEPYSKIAKNYNEDFFKKYNEKREKLRSRMKFKEKELLKVDSIRGNANLTIAKFNIVATTYKNYFKVLVELINDVDEVLKMDDVI